MAMERSLGSDPSYNMFMVKNPLHPAWDVRIGPERPYSLDELSEHLDLIEISGARLEQNFFGRNYTLFDSLRCWAYRHASYFSDLNMFKKAMYDEAERLNSSFPTPRYPLPEKEVRGIVKSVSRWTWTRYRGSGKIKREGIMKLDPNKCLRIRQQEGQLYTSRVRNNNTSSKIRISVNTLLSKGAKITKSAISRESSFSYKTICKHWNIVQGIIGNID